MNGDTNANVEDDATSQVNVVVDGEEAEVTNNMSASSSKIDLSAYEGEKIEDVQDINFILNIKILNNIVDLLGKCPECIQGKITASINLENKKGFAQQIVLTCICGWYHMVYSSNQIVLTCICGWYHMVYSSNQIVLTCICEWYHRVYSSNQIVLTCICGWYHRVYSSNQIVLTCICGWYHRVYSSNQIVLTCICGWYHRVYS